jgi:hypothetical protein
VAPIEWPITSTRPVHERAIASTSALMTGVSSLPLWSLHAAQVLLPQFGRKISFVA